MSATPSAMITAPSVAAVNLKNRHGKHGIDDADYEALDGLANALTDADGWTGHRPCHGGSSRIRNFRTMAIGYKQRKMTLYAD